MAVARDIASPDCVQVVPTRYGRMMCLSVDTYIGGSLIQYGEYSEGEVNLFRAFLRPDSVVVDAGANIGCHTVAMAQMVPDGMVLAAEPLRYLYYMLCGNVALNGLTNVLTFHAALGATRGSCKVPLVDYTLHSTYGGTSLVDRAEGLPVPQVRLDDLLPRVDFIKADVEGMERSVLEGASRLIAECRPALYVENNYHPDHRGELTPKQQDLIDFIHGLGYDLWWHQPPYFNPDNFRGNPNNGTFEWVVSDNMLGLPSELPHNIVGLDMVPHKAGVSLGK